MAAGEWIIAAVFVQSGLGALRAACAHGNGHLAVSKKTKAPAMRGFRFLQRLRHPIDA
jgi:hypothetical protein